MAKRYWLFKSEPNAYSFDQLKAEPRGTAMWDGVRNYQARNLMRDEMKKGDGVLFYHSSCDPAHVVGEAEIVRESYPDPTAFDPKQKYFDPKSDPESPTWYLVDIRYVRPLPRPVPLAELRDMPELKDMVLLRKGMRLSVQPVRAPEYKAIVARAKKAAPEDKAPASARVVRRKKAAKKAKSASRRKA